MRYLLLRLHLPFCQISCKGLLTNSFRTAFTYVHWCNKRISNVVEFWSAASWENDIFLFTRWCWSHETDESPQLANILLLRSKLNSPKVVQDLGKIRRNRTLVIFVWINGCFKVFIWRAGIDFARRKTRGRNFKCFIKNNGNKAY